MAHPSLVATADEARRRLAGRQIWLWHYMHADWQWEQTRHWHEERYALAVREALDILRDDPEFMYFFDTVSEFYAPVAERLGDRLPELKQRVAEGRIRLASGQVANCRPTQVGDETFIRNIQLGLAYFKVNLPPTDLSLFHSVDIAIGGAQMPQLLSQLGFQYYRAWRPHGPMNARGIPHQFLWQGIDGSRILVARGQYGGWVRPEAEWDDRVAALFDKDFHDQLLHDRSPTDHLWLIDGSDDSRPLRTWMGDNASGIREFVAEWRRRETVPIRWCTPLEYCQALAAQVDRLQVVEGVLDGADCGYNMPNHGAHGLWRWRQMNDRRLVRAEGWAAAAAAGAGFDAPHEALRKLWFQHCTYQAHAQDHGFLEDWDELVDRAREVKRQAGLIEARAVEAIVAAAGGGTRLTRYLFNPLPWPVEANIEIHHACATAGIRSVEAVDENGKPFAQQPLRAFRHPRYAGDLSEEDRLVRVALPPMGYRRIELVERPEPAPAPPAAPEGETLDTPFLKLTFRGHGLRSVCDKRSGRTYASRDGSPWPRLVYHLLNHQDWLCAGPEIGREPFQPRSSQWLEAGPLRWHHRSVGALGPYTAWLDTIVADRGRELQLAVRLDGHWEEAPISGFVTLLADIEAGGAMTVDTPFAVESRDPDRDIYTEDWIWDRKTMGKDDRYERLRAGLFWGRSWADWSGDGQGLTLISADGGYYWFKEPGQFGHVLLRGVELKAGTWERFCPVSLTGTGTHDFRYVLRFHNGDWRQADPQRRSLELRHPPSVARANHPAEAVLPTPTHSFLSVEGPALLSAYYSEPGAALLRLYEHTGRGGEVGVTLDWAPVSAQAVDLLGRPLDVPVVLEGRQARLTLKPWQIVTLRLGMPRTMEPRGMAGHSNRGKP